MAEHSASSIAPNWIDADKLLACIHCGLCLPSCPTHILSGEEMPSPRGRLYLMRAVLEGRLDATDAGFAEHETSCLECRACETACPSGVQFGYLMEQTRAKLHEVQPTSRLKSYIYTNLLRSRRKLNVLQTGLAALTMVGGARIAHGLGSLLKHSCPRVSAMLRLTPEQVKRPAKRSVVIGEGPRVALMIGCIGDAFTSEINDATIRVLRWLGYSVVPVTAATCCGALPIHAGYRKESIEMAEQMLGATLDLSPDYIVSSIAGCGAMLKDYKELIPQHPRLAEYSARVMDITELLAKHLDRVSILQCDMSTRVAYQAPCHLLHAQKVIEAPMAVISAVQNVTAVSLAENEICCGSAGSYNIEHPVESERLLSRKLRAIESDHPDIVLTANAGCLMQLRKGVREGGQRVPIYHIVEWLDSLIANGQ